MSTQTPSPAATRGPGNNEICQHNASFHIQAPRSVLTCHRTAYAIQQSETPATRRRLTGPELAARLLNPLARQA